MGKLKAFMHYLYFVHELGWIQIYVNYSQVSPRGDWILGIKYKSSDFGDQHSILLVSCMLVASSLQYCNMYINQII